MIEVKLDTYTEHFLFVEEPAKVKPIDDTACMACGTAEIISLANFVPDRIDKRMAGPTGIALATGAIGGAWFRTPGGVGTLATDLRSKSIPIDEIILGVTSILMVSTITFILGWQIGLVAAVFSGVKAYRQRYMKSQTQLSKTDKERQRLWDKFVENDVLERRRTVWSHLGYCTTCGTVHDLSKRKCTSWYNMLELFDDCAPPAL
ncbi:MAG: hypothetical protein P4L46_18055 [Fimbriimonas sp.]|nr:hypothetical protein [Fimbriimonas sp.]